MTVNTAGKFAISVTIGIPIMNTVIIAFGENDSVPSAIFLQNMSYPENTNVLCWRINLICSFALLHRDCDAKDVKHNISC